LAPAPRDRLSRGSYLADLLTGEDDRRHHVNPQPRPVDRGGAVVPPHLC
jgi:hypothetical protein